MDSKKFQRQLRKNQTYAEQVFWNLVRAHRFKGLKFRRQHLIKKYFVDFYCHELRLIIEIDGSIHDNLGQSLYDTERDSELTNLGYSIIRFDNDAVINYSETVLSNLAEMIKEIQTK